MSNSSLPHLQEQRRLFSNRVESLTKRQKGVAFIGMQHLFGRKATPEQGKATPFWDEKHYICTMKEMLETMPRIELALIIIGVSVLILGIILGYAMIHEYRIYLENHWKARYSFCDFIKRERFYIYLFLGLTFVVILGITVYIMAIIFTRNY